ncbi:2',3'-cyclic-nucleotide 2'-phosphodiesterase/5'-or 3'-nucleotidase, 5'-nucleotidase family [Loktanella salsilacus]|uniref:2',3'-cyclic-nucleotide 2'-phosphodiesterase/5'-or 3'-nucleotidase, 5'-nucleotidase family n=1 Tax=Loktanella salsilacus TaxID=195913 RepID=A0A1I4ITZ7_9RHOB|nr:5'-nucleotidase C-terminal domain-containing protein [Loktanella salsilacus]SFL57784.1 2',3'-cyclic-nucleotide 2'-phosphodiesterase/5'-or 3'-nucleotidase, 5'-nucleotidase family [Loktanella salsilacus]
MKKTITLLQMNDLHGYLTPHPELIWTATGPEFPLLGGLARMKTLFDRVRSERPGAVLALDNGDTFHGTHLAVKTKGEALIPAINMLGFAAMTAHWEFAWGPDHVEKLASKLVHPLLAANCYRKDTGERPFPATLTKAVGGLNVGIIGIAATIIDKSMPPHFSEGVRFTNGIDEVRDEAKALRSQGADLIVLLSHLGLPQDMELARQVLGIDVILSGHTHNRLTEPVCVNETLIIQSGCHGAFVGRLDLEVADGRIVSHSHALIPVDDSLADDPVMASLVAEAVSQEDDLSSVVGQTSIALHRNTCLTAPMDDVLLAAVAAAGGTDIAFSNGWRYGAPVPPGAVTYNDLWNIVPVDPPVSTVTLTGQEICDMMEENIERTFSCDPFGQMGGYLKRFRGLTLFLKLENPKGQRIVQAFAGSQALDPTTAYQVSFITAQGVPMKYGNGRQNLEVHAVAALADWFMNADQNIDLAGTGKAVIV